MPVRSAEAKTNVVFARLVIQSIGKRHLEALGRGLEVGTGVPTLAYAVRDILGSLTRLVHMLWPEALFVQSFLAHGDAPIRFDAPPPRTTPTVSITRLLCIGVPTFPSQGLAVVPSYRHREEAKA